jgi:tetratricopeptide (TPR) repeat protein
MDTLAAALAETGAFPDAVQTAKDALRLAITAKDPIADQIQNHLKNYEAGTPWRVRDDLDVLAILDQLRMFYLRLDDEYRSLIDPFPKVKRWSGPKAAQKFVTKYLSNGMNETHGQPFDSIVAALVEVAFDLPQGLGGGIELAVKDFQKAIELDPKSSDAHLWLGLAFRKTNRNADARGEFQKALDLNPARIWARQQLDKTPAQ